MLEINESDVSGRSLRRSPLARILSLLSVSVTAEPQWPFESAEYMGLEGGRRRARS